LLRNAELLGNVPLAHQVGPCFPKFGTRGEVPHDCPGRGNHDSLGIVTFGLELNAEKTRGARSDDGILEAGFEDSV
jgi:hypothetical protein